MRSLYDLGLKNIQQARLRSLLMALAVSLGVGVMVAADVFSSGVRAAWE